MSDSDTSAVSAVPAAVCGHTPGPWVCHEAYDNGEPCGFVVSAGASPLADVTADPNHDVEYQFAQADARLMASAPELLAALLPFADLLEDPEGLLAVNSVDPQLPDEGPEMWTVHIDINDVIAAQSAIAKARG